MKRTEWAVFRLVSFLDWYTFLWRVEYKIYPDSPSKGKKPILSCQVLKDLGLVHLLTPLLNSHTLPSYIICLVLIHFCKI